jgi:hypothetical protein
MTRTRIETTVTKLHTHMSDIKLINIIRANFFVFIILVYTVFNIHQCILMILLLLTIFILLISYYFTTDDADSNISCCLVLLPLLYKESLVVLVYCQARATPNDHFLRPNAATTVDYSLGLLLLSF